MSNPFNVKKPASALDHIDEPEINAPKENFAKPSLVGMTFNMPKDWHTEFKVSAAAQGKSMRDFLMDIFDHWKRSQR